MLNISYDICINWGCIKMEFRWQVNSWEMWSKLSTNQQSTSKGAKWTIHKSFVHLLSRLRYCNACRRMLQMLQQTVITCALFSRGCKQMNALIRRLLAMIWTQWRLCCCITSFAMLNGSVWFILPAQFLYPWLQRLVDLSPELFILGIWQLSTFLYWLLQPLSSC